MLKVSKRESGLMRVGLTIPGLRHTTFGLAISFTLLMVLVGCGATANKTPTPPSVAVSITTPATSQTVPMNGTLAITATVTNTTNTAITWAVNGVTNGNSTYGTITGSGLTVTYNAPAAVPAKATFNITATSQADTTKAASTSVTISAGVAVSMTAPTGPQNLAVNTTLGFTVSVTGSSNTGVTWTVNGVANGNSTYGTITGTGLTVTYNAPAAVPSTATFNVTATSVADTSKSASVGVTIVAGVAISIVTPSGPQNLAVSSSLGFTAAVTGTTNTGITWTVNGITNGNATYGTISGSGAAVVYDAPAAVPSPATFKVAATSVADTSKSASVSVTIVAGVVVAILAPSSPQNVEVNSTLGFTASVTGTTSTGVTWTVNGVTNGNSTYGTIAGSGLTVTYDAPAAVPSPATFEITATSVEDSSKSASVNVTITPVSTTCGSGNESILKGQYAFSLSGFNSSGYMAALGSFTADGSGHITAGVVDGNGAALGVKSSSITASGSSYSVGSDHRGCATIVTPFYTFATRFALEPPLSGVATEGSVEEWESGSTPYIASGQILKQTVPSAMSNGTYVYRQTGVFGSTNQYRTGVVGTKTASNGNITAGEYDSNVQGVHKSYSGITGTYTAPDPTTGRYTTATSLLGITNHRAGYLLSSAQFMELTTDALAAETSILIGKAQLQSGLLTLSGKLVYYATGLETAEVGLVTVTNSTSCTANVYEDVQGSWETPQPVTPACTYAIDSYGRVTTSGATCTTYLTTYSTMSPPVFYLTGPNAGVMLGTEPAVLVGQLETQSGTSITAGTYYFGTQETVNLGVETEVGMAALTSTGGVSVASDNTSTSSPQQSGQTVSDTLTVNADGTFSESDHPGIVTGMVISGNSLVKVDNQGQTYPTIIVIKMIPIG